MAKPVLFVSDLHLSQQRPAKVALFTRLVKAAAMRADSLYLLGDVFDFMWGDRDCMEPVPTALAAISEAVDSGLPVYFMNGNREFLLGHELTVRSGMALIPDPHVLELDGMRVALSHGDMLCTSDSAYMRYRRLMASAPFRFMSRLVPHQVAHLLAAGNRRRSAWSRRRGGQGGYKADVSAAAVEELMARHAAQAMVHGHIHAQGTHVHSVAGRTRVRYVLGDWIELDSVLAFENGNFSHYRAQEWLSG